jgi:hypothetical protein
MKILIMAVDNKNSRMKTTEVRTWCIKHLPDIAYSSGIARIKSSCNLKGNRFEMPNLIHATLIRQLKRRQPTN